MSAIRDVFASSIQRDYAHVRAAAKRAIEAMCKRPVMAEQGSDAGSPQRSLFGEVAQCDAVQRLATAEPRLLTYNGVADALRSAADTLGEPTAKHVTAAIKLARL